MAQVCKHVVDLLLSGLVDVSRCGCVGEAYWASEVAAIGDVNYGEGSVALVLGADSAVVRAFFDCLCARVV